MGSQCQNGGHAKMEAPAVSFRMTLQLLSHKTKKCQDGYCADIKHNHFYRILLSFFSSIKQRSQEDILQSFIQEHLDQPLKSETAFPKQKHNLMKPFFLISNQIHIICSWDVLNIWPNNSIFYVACSKYTSPVNIQCSKHLVSI